jgi:hypothetical protein
MVKIVLLMKEYTVLHIDLQKSCSHIITLPHQCAKYPMSTETTSSKQIINIFRGKINVFSFSNKLVLLENPIYYSIQIIPYVKLRGVTEGRRTYL